MPREIYQHLNEAADNPAVCSAVQNSKAYYYLDFKGREINEEIRGDHHPSTPVWKICSRKALRSLCTPRARRLFTALRLVAPLSNERYSLLRTYIHEAAATVTGVSMLSAFD